MTGSFAKQHLVTLSLITGVAAIATSFFPIIALPLAVFAIVMAIVSHLRYGEQKKWKVGLFTGIIAVIISIGVILFSLLVSIVGSDSILETLGDGGYKQQISSLEADRKTFASNEIAQFGPYDVTIASVQPSHTLTQEQQQRVSYVERRLTTDTSLKTYGFDSSDADTQYVQVTISVKRNLARSETYGKLATVNRSWTAVFEEVELNGRGNIAELSPEGDAFEAVLLFRLPKTETPKQLEYSVNLFTAISSIVGTEGMPSKEFIYTIQL